MARSTKRAIERALPEDLELVEFEGFFEILDDVGDHLALVALDPLQVEIDLSVVLVDPDDLETWGNVADRRLRAEVVGPWREKGFVVGQHGELHEGEAIEDPEASVWSYELPVTSLARDPEHLAELLAWARAMPRDFAMWATDTALTALEAS